ncbi:hypothetical protein IS481_12100 [Caldimonas thermodepolymerans]|uniref:Uncharacterized protein n=1 Tax=Caldimonas thermodepolymerans TaxID=215580 RepID=A0A2S5T8Z3_9BURK|nr:hypothetical protein [Caldimonas thermodepolymerans]PPE71484.1 hypothetical protein C1702_00325 [Caldimonas thermodepolymerans]QPC30512.1 hypothetical protein IS481_12100 [Caldimonas thermodepolymerans]RDI02902.1 hypothetical protein DES46_102330 [Caldimonas thermodepolymerans]
MSKKYLHIRENVVVAITLPGESFMQYGAIVEVPFDTKVGVGDVYPEGAKREAAITDVNAAKQEGTAEAPKRKKA